MVLLAVTEKVKDKPCHFMEQKARTRFSLARGRQLNLVLVSTDTRPLVFLSGFQKWRHELMSHSYSLRATVITFTIVLGCVRIGGYIVTATGYGWLIASSCYEV